MLDTTGGNAQLPTGDFIVDRDGRLTPAERRELLPSGRTAHDGFGPPGQWDLSPYVCCGAVTDHRDADAALLAAARGAGLLVGPIDAAIAPGFVDDLSRLAAATGRRLIEPVESGPVADPIVAALLEALADGLSVPAAARRCSVSLRTAHRRLAEARAALDLPTTGALVARSAQGQALSA